MLKSLRVLIKVLIITIFVSCREQEADLSAYHVDYDVKGGIINVGGVIEEPQLGIRVVGDKDRKWDVVIKNDEYYYSLELTTNEYRLISLGDFIFPIKEGNYKLTIVVTDKVSSIILYRRIIDVKIIKNSPPPVSAEIIDVEVKVENTGELIKIEEQSILELTVNYSGIINVRVNNDSEELALKVKLQMGSTGLTLSVPRTTTFKNNAYTFSFETNKVGEGMVILELYSKDEQIDKYTFSYIINEQKDPQDPEEKTVTLSVPKILFSGKESNAIISAIGIKEGENINVSLYVDDKLNNSISTSYDGKTIILPFGIQNQLMRGWHSFYASVKENVSESTIDSEIIKARVSNLSYIWATENGSMISDGLKYHKSTEKKILHVDLDCDAEYIETLKLQNKDTGKQYSYQYNNEWIFSVPHESRGLKNFRLEAQTECETFSWDISTKCYDEWVLEPYVDNKTIYAKITGPVEKTPSTVDITMKLILSAYVPYQDAIIENGEHIEHYRGQFIDIGYEEETMTIASGTKNGKIQLWTGNITQGIDYAKKQASKVNVTSNGASRWVNRNGSWVKEYYTPSPFPNIDIYILGTISGGNNKEYVSFSIDYDVINEWMKNQGVSMRGKEFWDYR